MSLNLILLIGNAGRDAELRYTPSGAQVANFSMAVSRSYQVNNEWQQTTEWFNVAAWGRQAENVAQRVRRGSRVFVEGRLSTRQYTTQTGESRTSLEVNAFRVMNLSGPQEEETEGQSYGAYGSPPSDETPPSTPAQTPSGPTGFDGGGEELEDLPW